MKDYFELFDQQTGRKEDPDNFIRRGKVGGHKEDMSEEMAKRFDEWMAEGPPEY